MTLTAPSLCFFIRQSDVERERELAKKKEAAAQREKRLFCARCRHVITHEDERIVVQGKHEHSFVNPHDFSFDIGCFRNAPGCVALGIPTAEHTWFKGYQWQIALCANCEAHLGWLFTSPADRFHGLILNRLKSGG